jgi:uncharacterized DUF497 family protein
MKYEWDYRKARTNLRKHGVDFADAVAVLEDEMGITTSDVRHKEARFVTVGMDALGRILIVVYTWRGETIRLVSARRATPAERRQYEG